VAGVWCASTSDHVGWMPASASVTFLSRHSFVCLLASVDDLQVYADDTDMYFSEFTFTSAACKHDFTPRVADGLLYAALHGDEIWAELVHDDDAVAEYVERTINGVSWVSVALDDLRLDPVLTSAHPSPLDMCSSGSKKKGRRIKKECLEQAKRVQEQPIRCIHFFQQERRGFWIGGIRETCHVRCGNGGSVFRSSDHLALS
jgi:hypothetical protein